MFGDLDDQPWFKAMDLGVHFQTKPCMRVCFCIWENWQPTGWEVAKRSGSERCQTVEKCPVPNGWTEISAMKITTPSCYGGWGKTPLKMKKNVISWGDDMPNIWEHEKSVPKHQLVLYGCVWKCNIPPAGAISSHRTSDHWSSLIIQQRCVMLQHTLPNFIQTTWILR